MNKRIKAKIDYLLGEAETFLQKNLRHKLNGRTIPEATQKLASDFGKKIIRNIVASEAKRSKRSGIPNAEIKERIFRLAYGG